MNESSSDSGADYYYRITRVELLGGGHVRVWAEAKAPDGEDWGIGFHIFEAGRDRQQGMAALSAPIHPIICDGQVHDYGPLDSQDAYGGGVQTTGTKDWGGKLQTPSAGTWTDKKSGFNGQVEVTS